MTDETAMAIWMGESVFDEPVVTTPLCDDCGCDLGPGEQDICEACIATRIHASTCPLCQFAMGDCDPPQLDGETVCPTCFEHEMARRHES